MPLELAVVEGDITALDVDVIVNAANDHLWMGAGVAGAIKRAGGEEIEREAVAQGPIPLGEAVATGAGRLKARHVVHGAVMGQDLSTDASLIERTTRRASRSPTASVSNRSRCRRSVPGSGASRSPTARG